ncbi:MAG: ribokinase [Verrucomicrobia bacterium]|nr:ribokinase [Verrucomicrobiota bacterium]MDA1066515.1 ribokinase [Verrucomicrobiota bacterium]
MASSIVVIGSYVQDLTFHLPEFPKPGQTLIGNFQSGPGGKGSNQAVAAARTGVSTAFIGATGQDAFAGVAREFHQSEGIDSHLAIKPADETGTAGILVNQHGENEIVVALGANASLTPADIPGDIIANAGIVVTQLECNLEATNHALKLARLEGVTTLLNPAPMRDDFPMDMLDNVDILIPNETEFAHLLRTKCPESHGSFEEAEIQGIDPEVLHELCREFGVPTFIITLGSKGCFVSTIGSHFQTDSMKGIDVVDTTGAGDAFVGGFASGLQTFDGDIKKAAEYGNVVAGLSVTRRGTAPSMPYKDEIEKAVKLL